MEKKGLNKYLSYQIQRANEFGMDWVVDISISPLSKTTIGCRPSAFIECVFASILMTVLM
jgi:hypothetical protein